MSELTFTHDSEYSIHCFVFCSFVTRFIDQDGLQCLLDFLQGMDNETLQGSIHTSIIGCIKALMNNSVCRLYSILQTSVIFAFIELIHKGQR